MRSMHSWFLGFLILSVSLKATDIFLGENYIADYLPIDANNDLFFWLFTSRDGSTSAPLIIFINGGPGSSSEEVVLNENGPFRIKDDGSLRKNIYSITNNADVLYLDQPICTGFSACTDTSRIPSDQTGVREDLAAFFNNFYDKYTHYKNRPTYFMGQSFAGHYIPGTVPYPMNHVPDMQVKGVAVGNPAISFLAYAKHNAYAKYALNHGMITSSEYAQATTDMTACRAQLEAASDPVATLVACQTAITSALGSNNQYDYATPCPTADPDCYDFTKEATFLARTDVLMLLNAVGKTWTFTNEDVNSAMLFDNINDYGSGFAMMLNKGVKVIIYYGERDFICNYEGGWNWLKELDWPSKGEIEKQPDVSLQIDGKEAIVMKRFGLLRYMKVHDVGYYVTMGRPEVAPLILEELFSFERKLITHGVLGAFVLMFLIFAF